MQLTVKPIYLVLVGVLIGGLAVGVVLLLAGGGGDGEPSATAPTPVLTATSVPPPARTATPAPPAPTATAVPPTAVPAPTQTPEPRVRSCGEIRATGYENDAERAFFLSSCISSPQAAGPTATPRPAGTPAAIAPTGPNEQEVAYRTRAQSAVTSFSVRLRQFTNRNQAGDGDLAALVNYALEFGASVRTFAYEVSINQPVPPRFRQAHDRVIASAIAFADHLGTSDSSKPAELQQWTARMSALVDQLIEDLKNYISVVGLR